MFNVDSKYALAHFNSEGNLINKNQSFQCMVYKGLSVIKDGVRGLYIRQNDKFMAQLYSLCIHLSAMESFLYSLLPQALLSSAGHKQQDSFLCQPEHPRICNLKGK